MNYLKSVRNNSIAKRDNLKKGIVFPFAFIVFAIALVFFVVGIGRVPMGLVLTHTIHGWEVAMVDSNGLAYESGIRPGDLPVEINGQPADIFLEKYDKAGTIFGNLINDLTVINGNGVISTANVNKGSPSPESTIEQIAFILVSLIFFGTGFYVFWKRPANQAALVLFLCGPILALALSANTAADRAIPTALELAVIATVVGPWLLVHFFLILPEERNSLRSNPAVFLIYVPAAVTLVLFPFIGYRDGQPLAGFHTFRLVEYAIAFVLAAIIAILNYTRATSPRTKQQMKIVLISCIIAVVPILFLNLLPQAVWKQPVIQPSFTFLFVAFIPLGMGYAVIARKLMDIDVVIRRGIIYGLITVVMAAIVSVAVFALSRSQLTISIPQDILIALGLGAVSAALFGPVQKGIENLVDRFIYKDRYDYRGTIQGLTTSLNSQQDFNDMARVIVGTAVQTLNLAGACLFIKNQTGDLELSVSQGTFVEVNKQSELLASLIALKPDVNAEFPDSASILNPEISFLVPLVAGNREVGMLCLSQKTTRQDFSSDDLFLIQGLASVAATALYSALLSRDVSVRDTFVSIASHELLTPLTSVLGYSDLLVKHEDDERKQRWAKIVSDNADSMAKLVNDLLNVSRIQSGKISLKLDRVRIADVLEDRLSLAIDYSNSHQFILDVAPDLPEVVIDRDKFTQIIWNLLSNAVKYSPKGGGIKLSARDDPAKHRVIVSITDQGIGISPEDAESLFKTFHRIQRPETAGIKGSGLGLYIVKEWIHAMGGQVWLESRLNIGSTFFIAVPASDSVNEIM